MKSAIVLLMILAAGCVEQAAEGNAPQWMARADGIPGLNDRCHAIGSLNDSTGGNPLCPSIELNGHAGSLSIEGMLVEPANESEDISPVVQDLDKDDVPEIIAGFLDIIDHIRWSNLLKAITPEGQVKWEFETDGKISANLLAEDVDGDGQAEIIAGTDNGTLYALNAKGRLIWTHKAEGKIKGIITVNSSNGMTEIIASAEDGKVRALDPNGMLLWEYAANATGLAGKQDEIMIGEKKGITALDADGTMLWENPAAATAIGTADINRDGIQETLAGTENGTLYALDGKGNLIWAYETGGKIKKKPAVADINNDGLEEIIIAPGWIQALDGAGKPANITLYGAKGHSTGEYRTKNETYATPVIADLDLDGVPEITTMTIEGDELVLSATRKFLANNAGEMSMSGKEGYIMNANAEKNSPYSTAPTVARLDKDPYPDRIYMAGDEIEKKNGRQIGSAIYIALAPSVKPMTDPAVNLFSDQPIRNMQEKNYSAEYSEQKKEVLLRIENSEEAYLMQYDGITSAAEKEKTGTCEKNERMAIIPYISNGTYMALESGTCALENMQSQKNGHELIFMKEKIGKGEKREIRLPVKDRPLGIRLLVVKDVINQECAEDCEALDKEWYSLGNARYVNIDVK